jgi:hypothetical protein
MWRRFSFPILLVALLASACSGGSPTSPPSATPAGATTAPTLVVTLEPTPVPTPLPVDTPTAAPTAFVAHTIEEPTTNEGVLMYDCDERGCWRKGSGLADGDPDYYPGATADSAEIAALLADIGLPATRVTSDKEAWDRLMALWAWFDRNAPSVDQAKPTEALTYLMSISYRAKPSHFPSLSDLAKTYARYHEVPWFSCTAAALQFVAIAYRVGIDPDRIATAFYSTRDRSIQHVYPIVRSGDHWYYVDAVCNVPGYTQALPFEPANVGCMDSTIDYPHPASVAVLPGSTITQAPLLR